MSNKIKLQDVGLPQESVNIEGVTYLITAMPATEGLKMLETMQEGKADLATMKQVICAYVSKDNMQITNQTFDVIFARKFEHLGLLYKAVLVYNFGDELFQEPDSED